MSDAHDPETLAFYDREAEVYAARFDAAYHARLDGFIDRLPHGARVLELGAGGGRDAAAMIARGLDVELTDGSVGLARQAEAKLGRPVRIMLFHELDAEAAYDGVWANASLLHAKGEALPDIFARVFRALRPGGLFYASFKAGEGGGRDSLGRYYNFPTEQGLRASLEAGGPWASIDIETGPGGGYDGVPRTVLHAWCVKR